VDGSSEVKYVGAAVLEITDRIKAEQALRESEQQFRDFSNSIQNLAWMAHGDGWIYWYNQRWYDYTGTTIEQMQGWGWTSAHHPDHVQRTTAFIGKAWQTGEQWELTFPLRRKDGQYHWFLTRAYPIKDDQGNVTRWIGTNTDIHEKLQIQQELQQSQTGYVRYRTLCLR
jgi:PAS domain S-box-containing protein